MQKKAKVLFLSRGNATRSQMAEGFLRALGADRFEASSAGIEPGNLNPLAIEVMKEAGGRYLSPAGQKRERVLEGTFWLCDYRVRLGPREAPIFPFTPNLVHWSIFDPEAAQHSLEEKKNVFRRVRDEIRAKIESFLSETTKSKPQLSKTAEAR